MSDNSKLKPCPLCGASARELAHDQIECSNIECVSFRYMALSFPRELWNTRATSSDVTISREDAKDAEVLFRASAVMAANYENMATATDFERAADRLKAALEKAQ